MQRPSGGRLALVAALLVTLLALCVWYATFGVVPAQGAYPTEQVVGPTPEQYVGDPVSLAGTVVATDPVTLRITHDAGSRTLRVTNLDIPVERGDELRVFGTLVDEDTVEATNAITIPRDGFVYTVVVSFTAGVWVLVRLFTQWRLHDGALTRRDEPLTLAHLRGQLTESTQTDA